LRSGCAGNQHALRYEELRERYAHMPASAVRDMLQLALARKRDAGMPGVTSILQNGVFPRLIVSALLSVRHSGPAMADNK